MKAKLMMILLLATAAVGQGMAGELDDILAKHYEAVGGQKTLDGLKSMKAAAKVVISSPQGEMEIPLTMLSKGGDKARVENSFQGMKMIQATDGEVAWQINPMMGSADAQDMSGEEAKMIKMRADLTGDLYGYKDKGYTVSLDGKEDVEGTEAHKIVVKDGEDTRYYYLDTEYYLIIKQASEVTMMGATQTVETYPSDYKKVGGVMFPFSMAQKTGMGDVIITFETVEFNVEIDDEVFKKPAPAAPAVEKAK